MIFCNALSFCCASEVAWHNSNSYCIPLLWNLWLNCKRCASVSWVILVFPRVARKLPCGQRVLFILVKITILSANERQVSFVQAGKEGGGGGRSVCPRVSRVCFRAFQLFRRTRTVTFAGFGLVPLSGHLYAASCKWVIKNFISYQMTCWRPQTKLITRE